LLTPTSKERFVIFWMFLNFFKEVSWKKSSYYACIDVRYKIITL
jgi:hypothetical protein